MPDLEALVVAARPDRPSPPQGVEERLLAGLGLAGEGAVPRAWMRRLPRSRRLRLMAVGLVLAGSGAALAVAITSRSAGSRPGPAASLSFGPAERAGLGGPAVAGDVTAGVAADGTVVAAWGAGGRVIASRRPPGGGWTAQRPLSAPGALALRPAAAGGAGSEAVVVWRQRVRGPEVSERLTLPGGRPAGRLTAHPRVRWRVMARDAGPDGGGARALSPAYGGIRDGDAPQVVATRDGGMVAAWAAGGAVRLASRARGGAWSTQAPAPVPGVAATVRLAAGPATDWVLATWWTRSDDPAHGRTWRPWAALRPPGAAWQAPVALDGPTIGWTSIAAAVDARGDAVAAWGPRVATRDAGGSWSRTADLPGASTTYGPAAGIDGEGRSLIAVTDGAAIRIARREPGGAWSAPVRVPGTARAAAVLPDAAGGLVVSGVATNPRRTVLLRLDRDGRTTARTVAPLPAFGSGVVAVGAGGTTALVSALRTRAHTAVEARVAAVRP